MISKTDFTGIVLAGGKSSRLRRDKALLVYHGKPLIQHAVDILRKVCDEVVISSNRNEYDFTGCKVWPDELSIQAPMIGIYSCLKRSPGENNFILSCDMPLISPHLFEFLQSGYKDIDIVIPVHDGDHIEPLCGIYNKKIIPMFEQYIRKRDYSMQHFIREAKCRLMEIDTRLDFYKTNMFININTIKEFNLLAHN